MKWRIVLTVLFVLTLFAGFAYLYVNAFVRKHQTAVILFVVNGLDLNTVSLARQQLGRSPQLSDPDDPEIGDARRRSAYRSSILNLDSFWNIALLGVQDAGQPVSDEGADATALACGQRVQNGYVGGNQPIRSLIYAAERAERATGLVTTSSLVQPTPVAFYSATMGTPKPYDNATELVYSKINIILGGGEQYFIPANASNEWGRRDTDQSGHPRNLLDEAKSNGYTVIRTRDELDGIFTWNTGRLFGVFAPDQFYFYSLQPPHPRQPSLAEMTRTAISCLNHNYGSYFLVVEHDLVARAGERNLGQLAVNEVGAVDQAIEAAVEYAGPDALVMVTNNYSLGAVSPLPAPTADDLLTPPSPDGKAAPPPEPQPRWLAGPGGPAITRAQTAWVRAHYDNGSFSTNGPGLLQPQPAFRFQTQAPVTAQPAWLASRGEGSLQLRGFISNTDVFDIVSEQF